MAEAGTILDIEKLAAGGDGLARLDGKVVFVPFALPGERVRAVLQDERKDWSQARIVEVLERSPHRVEPPCPVYGECGGCNLQHLAYPRQLEEKAAILAETFRRIARFDPAAEGVAVSAVPSLAFAYRNRLQLHFSAEGRVGFMRRGSTAVVEAPTCPIAVRPVQTWIEERAGGARGFEELKPFIVGKDRFIAFGLGDEVHLEGRSAIVEAPLLGKGIAFHVKGFFQSNLYLLENFVTDLLSGLQGKRAADLYCGVGLFAAFLGRGFDEVACVEQNPFSLELARRNAPGAGNEYHALSVEDWCRSPHARRPFDAVVVDPPRTGLAPEVRSWLALSRTPVVAYASCDPATLARDSAALREAGYRLESLRLFDFYPQTGHAECHARFTFAG